MEQDAIFENVKHEMVSEKLDNDDGQSNKELHDLEVNDNEDVNDAISNTGRKQRSDGKKSYFAECRICGKKGRRDKIKYHVKSTHSIFATSYKYVYICQKVVNTVQGFALRTM